MSEWKPIETAPARQQVLLYYPASGSARGREGHANPAWITIGFAHGTPRRPTHWMPLPQAPKETE